MSRDDRMSGGRWQPDRGAAVAVLLISTLPLVVCGAQDGGAPTARAPETDTRTASSDAAMPDADGWITLFDGTDLSAWRGYGQSDVPAGWQARDGLLTFIPGQGRGDLITRRQLDDFELVLDWRVGPAGNSGIFYRVVEGPEVIWHGAPELQVLDDAGHADGRTPLTSAGALYALYPRTADVVRPAGEWNEVRIVARGPHVEHWLNGTRVVEYEAWSDDWSARVRNSKFSQYPGFGEARRGHIGLQDHGDQIWYRDIRVRPLGGESR